MTKQELSPFKQALRTVRGALIAVALFSAAVNLLMLTGPLFMLQVYDRVLTSRSIETLVLLFALVCGLYAFLAFFDFLRTRVLSRTAYRFDKDLMPIAQKTWIYQGVGSNKESVRPVQDLTTVRQFVGSNAPSAFFDLPWVPLYLGVVFLLHFYLGLLASAGALIVIVLTVINEVSSRKPLRESVPYEMADAHLTQQVHKNADSVVAMGMSGRLGRVWGGTRSKAMIFSQKAGSISEVMTASTKGVRLLLQSSILALGAWLAILQEISPGTMIAASIIAGRALAPIDQVVGNWRNFARTKLSYRRLKEILGNSGSGIAPLSLPEPKGEIIVQNMTKFPTGETLDLERAQKPILQDIHFNLQPGDALGVVGPSASGKSSLARLLVGLWMPDKGSVRLDGATFDQWDREALGHHIGYLPQEVELIAGTVKQNIARFDPEAKDEDVVAAAELAGIHKMILGLPRGYEAPIGGSQVFLSGGQAQRIALARAVYNLPALVVLDEPNSNLDTDGDLALTNCINALREAGSTVIIMAHRPSAIAAVNKILMMKNGQQTEFGTKEEVLQKVQRMSVVQKTG